MFKKKTDKFALYLVDFATHLNKAVDYFVNFKVKDTETLKEFASTLKEYESEADDKVHKIIKDLNQAFITPIEREDILQLTMNLDDIMDGMDEFSGLMEIYHILQADDYMDEFSKYIYKCSDEILISMQLISDGKLAEIEEHAIKIKDHEHHCDDLYHESLKELFRSDLDVVDGPIRVIKYKEIYETLEEIADYCQNVANTLQSIIMKNA